MRDNPQADDLLKIAEATFRQEILPHLPADKKYTALMIANAMRIAARQFGGGENEAAAEIAVLSGLLDQSVVDNDLNVLKNLNKQFATAIRSGAFASGNEGHDKARKHLLTSVQNRLAEVNPKAIVGDSDDR